MRRLLLLALFLPACSQQGPVPAPVATAAPTPRPKPAVKKAPTTPAPKALEIVTPDMAVEPTATPELLVQPSDKHLLEEVAFKSEAEVLELLGEPDQKSAGGEGASWFYLREEPGDQGKRVCPEIQFLEGKARFVIFWTPEAMRHRIAEAKEEGKMGAKTGADFTFKDGFKHLGVGTSVDAVLTDIGQPDAKRPVEGGAEEWDYDTLIVEYGAARRMTLRIKDGVVQEVRGR